MSLVDRLLIGAVCASPLLWPWHVQAVAHFLAWAAATGRIDIITRCECAACLAELN